MPFPVVIALLAVAIVLLAAIYFATVGKRNSGSSGGKRKQKDRNTTLRDANRRLASNPRDHEALRTIADIYYDEETWDKAMKTYGILMNLAASNTEIEEWEVTARYGMAALRLKNVEEAYKSLMVARTMKDDSFEINYNLGYLEYRRGNIERAVQLLRHVMRAPDGEREGGRGGGRGSGRGAAGGGAHC